MDRKEYDKKYGSEYRKLHKDAIKEYQKKYDKIRRVVKKMS